MASILIRYQHNFQKMQKFLVALLFFVASTYAIQCYSSTVYSGSTAVAAWPYSSDEYDCTTIFEGCGKSYYYYKYSSVTEETVFGSCADTGSGYWPSTINSCDTSSVTKYDTTIACICNTHDFCNSASGAVAGVVVVAGAMLL